MEVGDLRSNGTTYIPLQSYNSPKVCRTLSVHLSGASAQDKFLCQIIATWFVKLSRHSRQFSLVPMEDTGLRRNGTEFRTSVTTYSGLNGGNPSIRIVMTYVLSRIMQGTCVFNLEDWGFRKTDWPEAWDQLRLRHAERLGSK